MAKIFVSYRRSDSAYVTAALCEKLQQRFGRDSVFYDIDAVPLGVDFRTYITQAVEQCNVLLAMIGDAWNDADDAGRRRLDDPANYVRIEIEAALRRSIPVVPVLVGEAQMPEPDVLPASLQEIVFRNATEIRAGRDFQQHIRHIIEGLDALFGDAVPRSGPPPLPSQRASASGPPPLRTTQEEDRVVRQIRQLLAGCVDAHLYLGGQIPLDKLHAARLSYAPQVAPQDILLLYDNTVFGGAKDGVILTRDALYWRNIADFQRPHCKRLGDIQWVGVKGGFATSEVIVDGESIHVQVGASAMIADALANVIRGLAPRVTV